MFALSKGYRASYLPMEAHPKKPDVVDGETILHVKIVMTAWHPDEAPDNYM